MTQTTITLEQITQPIKNAFNGSTGNKTVFAIVVIAALLAFALGYLIGQPQSFSDSESAINRQKLV